MVYEGREGDEGKEGESKEDDEENAVNNDAALMIEPSASTLVFEI